MISGREEPAGPNFESLRGLNQQMRHFLKKKKKQIAAEKQEATGQVTRETKCCKVCCAMFDKKLVSVDSPVSPAVCVDCQKLLDDGHFAIVNGNEYAFIKPVNNRNADLIGQIIHVCKETFDLAKKQANAKKPDAA